MMWWGVGAVFLVLFWLAVGRQWWRSLKLGIHLSRLTTYFERINAYGSMSASQFSPAERQDGEASFEFLRQFPRHVITRELLKNSIVAQNLGRHSRVAAMGTLLEALVEEGIALDADDFVRSYGH